MKKEGLNVLDRVNDIADKIRWCKIFTTKHRK